jgi:UDP-N-acetylmuramoyl-L-alanyl-D-glutamate--2,6-diaminopimelate ligase
VKTTNDGSQVGIHSSWGDSKFTLPLPGKFNVENAALVLAFLLQHGVSMADACRALSQAKAPPGRLQRVQSAQDSPAVYIDYAHTPAAIEVVLSALREHCEGKLWCVFGCGGDRDTGKRPLMGQAAERLADHIVITNDNPRTEPPEKIISDIIAGLVNVDDATVIADRAAAIAWTIATAKPTDIVLLAGKGHEGYQLAGTERLNFSDYLVASANLIPQGDAPEASE